jgi:uncharacterized protein YcnI
MQSTRGNFIVRRLAAVFAIAVVAVLALAVPAWGHVTVSPDEATAGSFSTLTFQVPNEQDSATTTKVQVNFPSEHPIADASVQPVPGWSVNVEKSKLTTPVTTDEGDTLDEAVKSVTWTATDGKGIEPGQFQQFKVSVGLPGDATTLVFPAVQTYSSGPPVNWVEVTPAGGPEPEHPAPTVTLTAGDGDAHGGGAAANAATAATLPKDLATTSDVDSAKTVGIIGIVLGALGLIVAIVALVAGRKKSAPPAA